MREGQHQGQARKAGPPAPVVGQGDHSSSAGDWDRIYTDLLHAQQGIHEDELGYRRAFVDPGIRRGIPDKLGYRRLGLDDLA